MKHTATILAALASCTPAHAEPIDCMKHAQVAKAIMSGRQMGMPITDFAKGIEHPVIQQQIIRAYHRQLWATERMKRTEISEFESSEYLRCVRGDLP